MKNELKWTNSDLLTAFENVSNFADFADLQEFLMKRRELGEASLEKMYNEKGQKNRVEDKDSLPVAPSGEFDSLFSSLRLPFGGLFCLCGLLSAC